MRIAGKRKQIRKLLSICLLVIALAACGKAPDTQQNTANRVTEPESAAEAGDTSREENIQYNTEKIEEISNGNTESSDKETDPLNENMKPEDKDEESRNEEAATAGTENADKEAADMAAQNPPSAWAGKKVTICGDSISTFTGYIPDYYSKFYPENGDITKVEDTWWMQVVKRTGMELLRNASYSGSTVSGQSQDENDGRYGCGNKRIADLAGTDGTAPDVIIILMGANDLLTDIPLGSYDGSSAVQEGNIGTFSEAYALMLDKMKLRYPETEIYCCTLAEVSRWNDETGEKFPYMNAHSLTAKDYNAWITAIAQTKDVNLIDVYNCGLTYENANENTSDGTHPNAAGAKLIADKVFETFK